MKTQAWRLLPGILLLVGLLAVLGLQPAPPVGAATEFTLTPASHDFGSVAAGATSAPFQFTVTNNDTSTLFILSIFILGGPFDQSNNCAGGVVAGASCTINATFIPNSVAVFSATLSVTSTTSVVRESDLAGIGVLPDFSLSPANHDFGSVAVGATSAPVAFTVTNHSDATLVILSLFILGGPFDQTNNCAGGVAAGGTCTINVTFAPTTVGPASGATLRVTEIHSGVRESTLAGTGTAAQSTFAVALTVTGDCTASLTPPGPYAADVVVTAQATFDAATTAFAGWTLDSTDVGWANPFTFPVAGANHTLVATCAARPTFGDLPQHDPAREAIIQLAARGYILGYVNGDYGSGDGVQRAQMAALIARATPFGPGIPTNGTLTPPACVAGSWDCEDWGNQFSDRAGLDANLWRNVGTLQHYQVAFGYDGAACAARGVASPCYGPTEAVSYAQTITFITRMMQTKGYWAAQPGASHPHSGVPAPHAADVATFHHYTGSIPAPPGDWNAGATRGWFARALWAALDSHWGTDRVP